MTCVGCCEGTHRRKVSVAGRKGSCACTGSKPVTKGFESTQAETHVGRSGGSILQAQGRLGTHRPTAEVGTFGEAQGQMMAPSVSEAAGKVAR